MTKSVHTQIKHDPGTDALLLAERIGAFKLPVWMEVQTLVEQSVGLIWGSIEQYGFDLWLRYRSR